MLMLATFGSSSFIDVNEGMPSAGSTTALLLGLLLLLAACGKSAQVPLQSWLLDAMEGPTPVSALIHAATMVTAGVYLVTRSNAIYAQSSTAGTAVVVVGTVTLLFGAWIGCAKDDIKRVLAGSTMSQIGYMMLAAGIGPAGYAYAIFLLLVHGFFKADMFLGAGSVMHATNDEVDMRHYGALRRMMPITFLTFAAGYLAIIGFPFFSGFYAKDHIIEVAFEQRGAVVGGLAMLGAGITAFYMTRLMLMTFFGAKRWQQDVHPHESPPVMTVPLILLGIASAIGGIVLNNWIVGWLDPAVGGGVPEEAPSLLHFSTVGLLTLLVVAIGVAISVWLFGPRRDIPVTQPASQSFFTVAGRNDLYGDAFNEAVFMRPGQQLTAGLVRVESSGIDGAVNGTASAIGGMSSRLRRVQNGFVRSYALTMTVGAAVVGVVILLGRLG
jgi:NADH-quinone oxidoreductase subunit L